MHLTFDGQNVVCGLALGGDVLGLGQVHPAAGKCSPILAGAGKTKARPRQAALGTFVSPQFSHTWRELQSKCGGAPLQHLREQDAHRQFTRSRVAATALNTSTRRLWQRRQRFPAPAISLGWSIKNPLPVPIPVSLPSPCSTASRFDNLLFLERTCGSSNFFLTLHTAMDSTHREDGPPSSTPSTRGATMASFPTSSTTNGLLSPTRTSSRKEKRNPSITPRRFGRFFTPRSNLTDLPTSRRILGTLEPSSTNRQPLSPQSIFSDPLASDPISPSSPTRRFAQDDDENESRKRSTLDEDGPSPKRRNILADMPPPPLNLPAPSTRPAHPGPSPTSSPAPTSKAVEQGLSELRKQTLVRAVSPSAASLVLISRQSEFFKASRGTARAAKGKPTMDTSKAVPNIPKEVIVCLAFLNLIELSNPSCRVSKDTNPGRSRSLSTRGLQPNFLTVSMAFRLTLGANTLPSQRPTIAARLPRFTLGSKTLT